MSDNGENVPLHAPVNAGERSRERRDEGDSDAAAVYVSLFLSGLLVFLFFPILLPTCIKVVHQYERAVIFRLGRVRKKEVIEPGVVFVFPCVDELVVQDIRAKCYSTPSQKILTKDSVTININAVVTIDVINSSSILKNRIGLRGIITLHAQTALRGICGDLSLKEIVQGKHLVSSKAKHHLQRKWSRSLLVKSVEIMNIELPKEMIRSMASEAISTRTGKAKVIQADGELRSARKLKEAADIISKSPATIQLNYIQTMANVAKSNNHTLVLPLPGQLMQLMKKGIQQLKKD